MGYSAFASQYADNNLTSTGAVGVAFGFPASFVKLKNNGAGAAYLNTQSTAASLASTNGFKVSSGETLELRQLGTALSGLAIAATSTGVVLELGAWG